jgi:hypothetical protein
VYAGYNNGFTSGGVVVIPASAFGSVITTVYSGDPVQSSPIVWSDEGNEMDYVYFTTNADYTYSTPPTHNGYCYSVDVSGSPPVPSLVWNPGTGGTYALQGFASDGGYVVYGDDGNTLYIFH